MAHNSTSPKAANILVHVGFPKCASTAMQRHLFNDRNLGFVAPLGEQTIHLLEHCRAIDTFEFDKSLPLIQKQYEAAMDQDVNIINVFSHEHIFLRPYAGESTVREGIRRLKAIFPNAKFLLIIRNQKSIITSSYREFLRSGNTATFREFIGDRPKRLGYQKGICRIYDFRYDALITHMYQKLGKENVIVFPFEELKKNSLPSTLGAYFPAQILSNVPKSSFELPQERSKRNGDFLVLPFFNRLRKPFDQETRLNRLIYGAAAIVAGAIPPKFSQRLDKKYSDLYEQHLGSFFTESNAATSKLLGKNLSELGYQ